MWNRIFSNIANSHMLQHETWTVCEKILLGWEKLLYWHESMSVHKEGILVYMEAWKLFQYRTILLVFSAVLAKTMHLWTFFKNHNKNNFFFFSSMQAWVKVWHVNVYMFHMYLSKKSMKYFLNGPHSLHVNWLHRTLIH